VDSIFASFSSGHRIPPLGAYAGRGCPCFRTAPQNRKPEEGQRFAFFYIFFRGTASIPQAESPFPVSCGSLRRRTSVDTVRREQRRFSSQNRNLLLLLGVKTSMFSKILPFGRGQRPHCLNCMLHLLPKHWETLAKNWKMVLEEAATEWGVPPGEVTKLGSMILMAENILAKAQAIDRNVVVTTQLNAIFNALVAFMRDMKRRYFLTPPLDDAGLTALGLRIPDTTPTTIGVPRKNLAERLLFTRPDEAFERAREPFPRAVRR
jgi:hypothetical protein